MLKNKSLKGFAKKGGVKGGAHRANSGSVAYGSKKGSKKRIGKYDRDCDDVYKTPVKSVGLNKDSKKKLGDLGENIAVSFLEKHGFEIIERNFRSSSGELDIIAQKDGIIYIIEVKTAKIDLKAEKIDIGNLFNPDVSIIRDGEGGVNWFTPEMNLTPSKINKIRSTAMFYGLKTGIKEEMMRFLAVCVTLYCDGSRVTRDSILNCRVKTLPLFD